MKKQLIIFAAVVMGMSLSSCSISIDEDFKPWATETVKGDGNVVTRDFDVTAFDQFASVLPATVNYTVGDTYTCTVTVDENLFDYIEVRVKDGELLLGKPKTHKHTDLRATDFVIDITAPSLEEARLAGSGDIVFLSPLNTLDLEIDVAGSGNVVFKEEATIDHLELNVAGSGDIYLEKGAVRELEADIAGSGKIVSRAEVEELDANVAGSGDITAKVNGTLEYFIAGSGDIKYYGDPKVNGRVAGSGSVSRIDATEW